MTMDMEPRDIPPEPRDIPPEPPGLPPPRKGSRNTGRTVLVAVIAALLAAVAVMFVVPLFFGTNPVDVLSNKQGEQTKEVQEVLTVEERVIEADQEAVAEAAQQVLPCTVNLEVEIGRVGVGIGSGFIYRPDGYIVTNNHVVEDATSIKVALQDGTIFEAEIVGTDPETDLAVIKIDDTGLPAVELGTSSDLVVGELAIAIGSPEGFQGSVTSGIVSALNRNVYIGTTPLLGVIQTDAAINPGNSGGPLCNISGEVIGITTAIYSESGGYDGLGFVIPIDSAEKVIEQLIETGAVVHPWLGFTGSTLEPEVAERYDLPVDHGAIVRRVVDDTPAEKAGLEAGDIIVAIDGTTVESMDQLMLELRGREVGDTVTIDFYRDGERIQAEATLEEKPVSYSY